MDVAEEDTPFSLFFPPLTRAMGEDANGGLEGAAPSLLGAAARGGAGLGLTVDGAGDDEGGASALFFWKKPRIVLCPFCDCDADAEDVLFFSDGFGVATSFPSIPRAMIV